MKDASVKDNTYIDKKCNNRDTKSEVDDHVIISKYKNLFARIYTTNQFKGFFMIKNLKYYSMDICH